MKLSEYLEVIETFLAEYLKNAHAKKYVLGLSGGVDSSLTLALACRAVGKENVIGLIIPIESSKEDVDDALTIAEHFGVQYKIINLDKTYKEALNDFGLDKYQLLTKANLKVRLRMLTLYAFAQEENALVLGTDNKAEHYVGYFTKYGDGAADVNPIIYLTKSEVVESALLLDVPAKLAKRIPSAGLYSGQSDEQELGFSYDDLDAYLLGKQIDKNIEIKIENMHRKNMHKLIEIASPGDFDRS